MRKITDRHGKKFTVAFGSFTLRQKIALIGLTLFGVILFLNALWLISQEYTVTTAARGGSLTEGLIGSPRFINPLLATSETDRDLVALVYSGLLRLGENGELIPDLAETYDISPDGRTYTFTLKNNLTWHDGKKLTARDVIFTVNKIQDAIAGNNRRANWEGVTVEQSGDLTVIFHLDQPYAPFIENLTLGIIPAHLWSAVDAESFSFSDFNSRPIGSGPYKIKKINRDRSGIPVYYDLESFNGFALGEPQIKHLRIKFFPNESSLFTAIKDGEIRAASSLSPQLISSLERKDIQIKTTPLPRSFGLFFNQNQADIFTRKEVRQALDLAIDREEIIDQVLAGYGVPVYSPIPGFISGHDNDQTEAETIDERRTKAKDLLTAAGWQENENGTLVRQSGEDTQTLAFSIATADAKELKQMAELLKKHWQTLGAEIEIKVFETGNLNQTVIRPRKYDALLFGLVIGRIPDPYAFWHSSQRLDPGLNIALYANITTDKLLEELQVTGEPEARQQKLETFLTEVRADIPAVFVYAPELIYLLPAEIKNVSLSKITDPSERFNNIHDWYIKTEKVWTVLSDGRKIISL